MTPGDHKDPIEVTAEHGASAETLLAADKVARLLGRPVLDRKSRRTLEKIQRKAKGKSR